MTARVLIAAGVATDAGIVAMAMTKSTVPLEVNNDGSKFTRGSKLLDFSDDFLKFSREPLT